MTTHVLELGKVAEQLLEVHGGASLLGDLLGQLLQLGSLVRRRRRAAGTPHPTNQPVIQQQQGHAILVVVSWGRSSV